MPYTPLACRKTYKQSFKNRGRAVSKVKASVQQLNSKRLPDMTILRAIGWFIAGLAICLVVDALGFFLIPERFIFPQLARGSEWDWMFGVLIVAITGWASLDNLKLARGRALIASAVVYAVLSLLGLAGVVLINGG